MISHINFDYTSNVLEAFYVHNEWIVMETSKTLNAGILFQTTQLGAWEAFSDRVYLLILDFLLNLSW